jgi:hypothetical protein
VKKAKKPARSIRYLLSANPTLQKISLRRISERLKKAKQPLGSPRSKNSAGARNRMRAPWAISSPAIGLGVICVIAAAALITAGQPSHRVDVTRADAPPDTNAPLEHVSMAARPTTKKTVVSRVPATPAAAKTHTADVSIRKMPTVESVKAPAVESTGKADVQKLAPVTITGCLARDNETFWLKDTSGVDAPTSRSWKSGFLKKRPSRIELVDTTQTLNLPSHLGQHVAATGIVMNRKMGARSLRRVAPSCD